MNPQELMASSRTHAPLHPSESDRRVSGSVLSAEKKIRVAFVVQRCGLEVNGGAELLCRQIAAVMSREWDVEVLTTCALDYMTWANHYPAGDERIGPILIRRFDVDAPRDVQAFNRLSENIVSRVKEASLDEQEMWMRAQGPVSTSLLSYLEANKNNYAFFVFFGYLYAQSYFGLPIVAARSILVPCAHDEWPIHLTIWDRFFSLPRGIVFNTPEEREFTLARFPALPLNNRVAGVGIDSPPSTPDPDRFRKASGIRGPVLIYVGRIDPSKGCDTLFEWFLRAKATGKLPHTLVLVGRASMPIPKDPAIVALGFIDEQMKFDALSASEWLLMPSAYESLSIALLEAWSVGTPAIVNAHCNVLVGHCDRSQAGITANSPDDWIAAVAESSESKRRSLGRAGKLYVENQYTWSHVAAQFLATVKAAAQPESTLDSRMGVGLAADLQLVEAPETCTANTPLTLRFTALNTGTAHWLAWTPDGHGTVKLGVHLASADQRVNENDYGRAPLRRICAPGESVEFSFNLDLPTGAERWFLVFDLVAEGVCWFASHGTRPVSLTIEADRSISIGS